MQDPFECLADIKENYLYFFTITYGFEKRMIYMCNNWRAVESRSVPYIYFDNLKVKWDYNSELGW